MLNQYRTRDAAASLRAMAPHSDLRDQLKLLADYL
jgi:hypothetical protein